MGNDKPQDVKGTFLGSFGPEELNWVLFEEAADSMFVTDPQGRLVAVNLPAINLVGYSREELIGMAAADLIPAADPAPDPVPTGDLGGEWIATKEKNIRHKDGGLISVEISARTLSDGSLLRIVRDISGHRQLEAALQESEVRLSTLIDQLPAEVWVMDSDLCFTMQNAASSRVVGNVVGKRIEDLPVAAEVRAKWVEQDRRVLDGNTLHEEYQIEVEGEQKAYENFVAPVRMGETVVGLVGIAMDITARKQAEEALQRDHAELEQRVEERTTDLAQANRMLKILTECNQTVVRATEEPALLQDVCRIIVELGGYPLVWIGLAEQDATQTVRPVAQAGFEDGYLESINITWADTERGRGPTGTAIRSGQPCIAKEIQTDPDFAPWREDAIRRGYASSIALPLRGTERVFGALNIYAPVADAFHAEEVQLLMELASDLAFGITSVRERAERNRAEEAVRESEARHRAIVEAFDGLIYVCSPDYRVEFMNKQLLERTGYDGTGELCYKALHDLDSVCPWCVNDRVFAGETVRWEVQSPKDDRWYYVVNTPIYHADGSMSKQAMILDITERKQAEDELRQTREAALQFSEQLAALQEVTNELSKAESSDDLCQMAVQLGRSRLGFDRVSIWFIEEHLGIMRGSFGTDERGELRDERNAQVELRHEGLAWRLFSHKEPKALVEHCPLCDHLGREVGEGDNALAALWDGDEVIGVICVDNLFTGQPIRERQLEVLRLYATTLGHLITRKQADEARRATETRFRAFVDHAADAFFLHDERGTILDVNRQACESLGYSREELIGMTPHGFDADLDNTSIDQITARVDAGEVIAFDTRHRRKDGTVFPVEMRVRPFWQGEHRFTVSLARDITERKQVQEALNLFRSLIDHANDIIEVADPETGRFLDVNERACLAHGYTREEYLALTIPQINPVVAARSWKETMEELRRSGSFVRESQHRRKDGSIFPVEINISYVRLDRDYVLAVVRDITQRKQAERELQRSNELLRAIIEAAPTAIIGLDLGGNVQIVWNPAAEKMLGWSAQEAMGHPLPSVPQDKEEEFWQFRERIRSGETLNGIEVQRQRRDGTPIDYSIYAAALHDPEGQIAGNVAVLVDITERKRAELALQQRASQLALLNEVGRRVATLLDLDEVLDRAAHLIQELFGFHHVGLFTEAEGEDRLRMRARAGEFAPLFPPDHSVALGQGMVGWVGLHGETLLANDVDAEPRHFKPYPDRLPTRSELSVPMQMAGKTVGVLDVQSPQPNAFDENDVLVLETLASQIAVAIENARLYEAEQRQAREAAAVSAIAQTLNGTTDLASVFQVVARHLEHVADFDRLSIALSGNGEEQFTMYALSAQEGAPLAPGVTMPLSVTAAAADIVAGRPHLTPDLSAELDFAAERTLYESGLRSRLNLPLVLGETVVGALNLASYRAHAFSPSQLPLLNQVADAIAAAVQNARLYEETVRRNRELALLNRVIAASAASQEIETILETVCCELSEALNVPHSAAALLNAEKTEAVVIAEHRANDRPPIRGQTIPVSEIPLAQHLLQRRSPLVIEDAGADARLGPICNLIDPSSAVCLLILPILVEGEMIGSLGVAAVGPHSFSSGEVDLAWRVAEQVSGALARARLAETERRLSAAIDQATEAMMVTDTEATILYVNPAFERIFGYSRAEAIGQSPRILRSDKLDAAFHREMWQAATSGQVWQEQCDYRRRDGSVCSLDLTAAPVRDQAGEIVNYVATIRDVTREVQLERQFQQAQKMEALGRLAGGIAHDFNNLLTIIHLGTQLLERQILPEDPLWKLVQDIREAGNQGASLTRQLLSFSRQEVIRPRVLKLSQVVTDLSRMLQRVLGEDIRLATVLADGLWSIQADPAHIDQVIVNLAVNARDAMPGGGVLTIETANVVLDEAYAALHVDAQPGEHVLLVVSDTGIGMGDEVKARIFEPFFSTKERGQGTGLGLATVFGIVKQSDGHIEVYSEVGQGTTFKIYLPRIREAEALPEAPFHALPSIAVRLARGTETVLLVEDDTPVRELALRALESCGYRVLAAGDGLQALQIGQQHDGPIHLLLTDVVMPQMSGRELAGQLQPRRPEMRVLYMSGYTDNAIARHGVLAPGVAFLPKPFTIEDLTQMVRETLSGDM
jgi:PAS domain S-box-containing protein